MPVRPINESAEEALAVDTLFLACTRPAMFLGVPMEAMGINLIVSGVVFLGGGNLFYLLIAPVTHMVCQSICRHDHNAFSVLLRFLDTKARARNGAVWGGSSCTPLRLVRSRRPQDLGPGAFS
jgi:type IV secretion system protein VirB3